MGHKTVWMVSGNKGGVGKSLFCKALASALDLRGDGYAVLDGDGRTGDVFSTFHRKCPARLADFRALRPESHQCSRDAEYEGMLHQLLLGSDHLIVNTPDGADSILMKWFEVTLKHTESNNCQFKFVYLLSDRPDGLEILNDLRKHFHFLYPIRNLYFGRSGVFSAFNQTYSERFNTVLEFPVLRSNEVRMLFDLNLHPVQAIQLKGLGSDNFALPSLTRSRLFSWQNKVCEEIDDMIDNKTEPNLCFRKWETTSSIQTVE